jgi:hypothetical protein
MVRVGTQLMELTPVATADMSSPPVASVTGVFVTVSVPTGAWQPALTSSVDKPVAMVLVLVPVQVVSDDTVSVQPSERVRLSVTTTGEPDGQVGLNERLVADGVNGVELKSTDDGTLRVRDPLAIANVTLVEPQELPAQAALAAAGTTAEHAARAAIAAPTKERFRIEVGPFPSDADVPSARGVVMPLND